ncbi:hypothetical protein NEFER03_1404 [Nematocida sp. LUAm3]|nr:hypothetical protein NEFER03_1404 [Nematocida sp. LUAm3]KAI5174766.1 hypothetical protein NEFER02_0876 [Nematocida sp. LUAm2]KAI5177823.1 hypothetical protein NEFER01_1025 [Nematocida sp. LUAm1]
MYICILWITNIFLFLIGGVFAATASEHEEMYNALAKDKPFLFQEYSDYINTEFDILLHAINNGNLTELSSMSAVRESIKNIVQEHSLFQQRFSMIHNIDKRLRLKMILKFLNNNIVKTKNQTRFIMEKSEIKKFKSGFFLYIWVVGCDNVKVLKSAFKTFYMLTLSTVDRQKVIDYHLDNELEYFSALSIYASLFLSPSNHLEEFRAATEAFKANYNLLLKGILLRYTQTYISIEKIFQQIYLYIKEKEEEVNTNGIEAYLLVPSRHIRSYKLQESIRNLNSRIEIIQIICFILNMLIKQKEGESVPNIKRNLYSFIADFHPLGNTLSEVYTCMRIEVNQCKESKDAFLATREEETCIADRIPLRCFTQEFFVREKTYLESPEYLCHLYFNSDAIELRIETTIGAFPLYYFLIYNIYLELGTQVYVTIHIINSMFVGYVLTGRDPTTSYRLELPEKRIVKNMYGGSHASPGLVINLIEFI